MNILVITFIGVQMFINLYLLYKLRQLRTEINKSLVRSVMVDKLYTVDDIIETHRKLRNNGFLDPQEAMVEAKKLLGII